TIPVARRGRQPRTHRFARALLAHDRARGAHGVRRGVGAGVAGRVHARCGAAGSRPAGRRWPGSVPAHARGARRRCAGDRGDHGARAGDGPATQRSGGLRRAPGQAGGSGCTGDAGGFVAAHQAARGLTKKIADAGCVGDRGSCFTRSAGALVRAGIRRRCLRLVALLHVAVGGLRLAGTFPCRLRCMLAAFFPLQRLAVAARGLLVVGAQVLLRLVEALAAAAVLRTTLLAGVVGLFVIFELATLLVIGFVLELALPVLRLRAALVLGLRSLVLRRLVLRSLVLRRLVLRR